MLGLTPSQNELITKIQGVIHPETPIYLVGGAVRDGLLGRRPIQDLDFVLQGDVLGLGKKVADVLEAAYYPLDEQRATARLILPAPDGSRMKLDFALMRGPDLESDLRGRDFTINAIAQPLDDPDVLIDPLGGLQHLRDKWIVHCSNQAFTDDPVRVLRSARLAVGLGFKITPETIQKIRASAGLLPRVSPERLRDELFRCLEGPHPATVIRLLDRFGILPYLLPELEALKGLVQPKPHIVDAFDHSLDFLDRLSGVLKTLEIEHNPETTANWTHGLISVQLGRFRLPIHDHLADLLNPDRSLQGLWFLAGLYHDVGKPVTRQLDDQGKIRFLGHESIGADLAMERGRHLRLSTDEVERLGTIIRNHMRPLLLSQAGGKPSRRAVYRYFRSTGSAGIDVGLISLADVLAIYGATLPEEAWIQLLEVVRTLFEAWWERPHEAVSPPALVNGHDLMEIYHLQPGPQIGALLESIREAQAVGQVTERAEALELAEQQLRHAQTIEGADG